MSNDVCFIIMIECYMIEYLLCLIMATLLYTWIYYLRCFNRPSVTYLAVVFVTEARKRCWTADCNKLCGFSENKDMIMIHFQSEIISMKSLLGKLIHVDMVVWCNSAIITPLVKCRRYKTSVHYNIEQFQDPESNLFKIQDHLTTNL